MVIRLFSGMVLAAGLLAGCNSASGPTAMMDHEHHDNAAAPHYMASEIAAAVDVGNTVCPDTGDAVGDSKSIAIYDGKLYHFCCGDCYADFKKDPQQYVAKMNADPAKYGIKK